MSGVDIQEMASRSEAHAAGVAVTLALQAGLERQRRIIHLREELEALQRRAGDVRQALSVAEKEHELERGLFDVTLERFNDAATRASASAEGVRD